MGRLTAHQPGQPKKGRVAGEGHTCAHHCLAGSIGAQFDIPLHNGWRA